MKLTPGVGHLTKWLLCHIELVPWYWLALVVSSHLNYLIYKEFNSIWCWFIFLYLPYTFFFLHQPSKFMELIFLIETREISLPLWSCQPTVILVVYFLQKNIFQFTNSQFYCWLMIAQAVYFTCIEIFRLQPSCLKYCNICCKTFPFIILLNFPHNIFVHFLHEKRKLTSLLKFWNTFYIIKNETENKIRCWLWDKTNKLF